MTDPLVYARFVHFAATIAATSVVFFVVLVLARSGPGLTISSQFRTL